MGPDVNGCPHSLTAQELLLSTVAVATVSREFKKKKDTTSPLASASFPCRCQGEQHITVIIHKHTMVG